jgi:hypothetical protein
MLLVIASSLFAVWGLGVATAHTFDGYLHIALFFAAVALVMRFLMGDLAEY